MGGQETCATREGNSEQRRRGTAHTRTLRSETDKNNVKVTMSTEAVITPHDTQLQFDSAARKGFVAAARYSAVERFRLHVKFWQMLCRRFKSNGCSQTHHQRNVSAAEIPHFIVG